MANSQTAAAIGSEYARMLFHILPKIEDSIKRGNPSASFSVKAHFKVGKTGGVEVTLSQTASIPMESQTIKLSYNSGQLMLFEGSVSEQKPTKD